MFVYAVYGSLYYGPMTARTMDVSFVHHFAKYFDKLSLDKAFAN